MTEDYFEWDGESHLQATGIWDWIQFNKINDDQSLEGFCDCFHIKGCCSLVINGEKVRAGDKVYNRDGVLGLVRGDTEPFICPTHGKEHSGIGPYICITTGEFE